MRPAALQYLSHDQVWKLLSLGYKIADIWKDWRQRATPLASGAKDMMETSIPGSLPSGVSMVELRDMGLTGLMRWVFGAWSSELSALQ
mmetsp:Transcript_5815/g.9236  ORF Transcript_5815/g.9236 Transcript_5815/m.9236 type:complete len:88 (+) Transcript_5815:1368-1631(+)